MAFYSIPVTVCAYGLLTDMYHTVPAPQTQSWTDINPSNSDAIILPLPLEWNKGDDTHSFRYTHDQSAMKYLVKVSRLGKKAVVFGLGIGDEKTASFDVAAAEFISESLLPATPIRKQQKEKKSSDEDGEEEEEQQQQQQQMTSIGEAARTLQDIFISVGRLSDLGSLIRLKLIQKLTPGIRKEGYEEDHPASTTTSSEPSGNNPSSRQPSNPQSHPTPYPHGLYDPSVEAPAARARPFPTGEMRPPGFEDEYDILRPAGRAPMGGSPFGNVGERDLYPPGLGPRDPLRPHLGGGGGGGGMHPTFDDPMFGTRGGGGGQGYDPQAPPGARYDPVGPGSGGGGPRDPRGGMGGMGGGGGRFPGGGGGGPPNPFGGFGSGDFI